MTTRAIASTPLKMARRGGRIMGGLAIATPDTLGTSMEHFFALCAQPLYHCRLWNDIISARMRRVFAFGAQQRAFSSRE